MMLCFSSGTASDSICPKGWRLPGAENDDSWYKLMQNYVNGLQKWNTGHYSDTAIIFYPISLIHSGYANPSLTYRSTLGAYWTQHFYDIKSSRNLIFANNTLEPRRDYSRSWGLSLRCLAR